MNLKNILISSALIVSTVFGAASANIAPAPSPTPYTQPAPTTPAPAPTPTVDPIAAVEGELVSWEDYDELYDAEYASFEFVSAVAPDDCSGQWAALIQAKKNFLKGIVVGGLLGLIPVAGPALGAGVAINKTSALIDARDLMMTCCTNRQTQTSCRAAKDANYLK